MNIQVINFGAKQRFEYTKPRVKCDSKTAHPTLKEALAKYEKQELIENAKAVTPTIIKASEFAQNKANKVIKESKLIQDNADDLFEKIEATNAYNVYFNDKNGRFGRTMHLYPDEVKFGDKLFDITIYPDRKITAVERNNGIASRVQANVGKLKGTIHEYSAKDVYEFDVQTGELTYFAQGHKKEGYVTSIEKEFQFVNGKLDEYNEGVSKGEFNLISQSFKFISVGSKEILESFATMKRQTWNKDISERLFIFDNNGTLKSFSRGFVEDINNRIQGELYYKFNEKGELVKAAENFKGGNITINGKHDIYID